MNLSEDKLVVSVKFPAMIFCTRSDKWIQPTGNHLIVIITLIIDQIVQIIVQIIVQTDADRWVKTIYYLETI